MKMSGEQHEANAQDWIAMSSPAPEPDEQVDRAQLAEQLRHTIADTEDVEAIASLIEATLAQD